MAEVSNATKFVQEQGNRPETPIEKWPALPEVFLKRMPTDVRDALVKWNEDCSQYFRRQRQRGF